MQYTPNTRSGTDGDLEFANGFRSAVWRWVAVGVLLLMLVLGAGLRANGLFRGLTASSYTFHPDESKQVRALERFLGGEYGGRIGSLAYDGYPYGLNHVDEWILRGTQLLVDTTRDAVLGFFYAGEGTLERSAASADGFDLYRYARGLRVWYSLVALLAFAATARYLGIRPWLVLAGLLGLTLSPLAATVTHAATGDVGVDLFGSLALLALAWGAARGRDTAGLMLSALCTGMAFACKYHGALVILAAGLYALLTMRSTARPALLLGGRTIGMLAAFVVGAVALTPMLVVDPGPTWRDILANFEFIKNYNVTEAFLAMPAWERVTMALAKNTGPVICALGIAMTLLALAGLVWNCRRTGSAKDAEAGARRIAAARTAVAMLPFLALLISLAGKPEVQAFHFAWIQAPMVLAGLFALDVVSRWRGWRGYALAVALALAPAAEAGFAAVDEQFFWGRPDNLLADQTFRTQMLRKPILGDQPVAAVKSLRLERSTFSIFRNYAEDLCMPDAVFWRMVQAAPVSPAPLPDIAPWVFLDGPAYPRSDRFWIVPAEGTEQRYLVFQGQPTDVRLGFRAGVLPVRVEGVLGGTRFRADWAPDASGVLTLRAKHWTMHRQPQTGRTVCLVPLKLRALTGSVAVEVLWSAVERALFDLYSGKGTDSAVLAPWMATWAGQADKLDACRYWDSAPDAPPQSIPNGPGGLQLTPSDFRLAAGAYRLTVKLEEIEEIDGSDEVSVSLEDAFGRPMMDLGVVAINARRRCIERRFTKPYAPYETHLVLRSKNGLVRVHAWDLSPDADRMLEDIQQWVSNGVPAGWMSLGRQDNAGTCLPPDRPARWEQGLVLDGWRLGETVQRGEPLPVSVWLQTTEFPVQDLLNLGLFIHMVDSDGQQKAALGLPAPWLLGQWHSVDHDRLRLPTDLPPGVYSVRIGLYNIRTGHVLKLSGERITDEERRFKALIVGDIRVTLP